MISAMLLLLLPFATGSALVMPRAFSGKDWAAVYLYGSLAQLVTAGAVALPAVKFRLPFSVYRTVTLAVYALLALAGLFALLRSWKRGQDDWRVKVDAEKNSAALWACVAVVLLLAVSYYYQYVPETGGDMTAETMQTTLHTDTMFAYDPATGQALKLGIYPQDKLMVLPLVYCVFYRPFGGATPLPMELRSFLYRLVPMWVLTLNALVFWKWSEALFRGQTREKCRRALFLLFYGAANLFGDYLFITFSYRLLHQAWMGETILITVLLPLLALQWFALPETKPEAGRAARLAVTAGLLAAGLFCAPWREVLILGGATLLAAALTALIGRKLHESGR